MENESMNQQQPAPQQSSPIAPQGKKGGHGGLIAIIVIIIVVIVGFLMWGNTGEEMQPQQTEEATQQEDLSAIEAELDATVFEGISEGL